MAKVKKAGAVRKIGRKKVAVTKRAPSGARKTAARKKSDPVFHVLELDPQRKCGLATSVQRLYRVRETWTNGAVLTHLVFFDRHGWYCEHGRNCPAVPHAKKLGDRERQRGPTHNARMRA